MSLESLKSEIEDNRKKISTDGYKMSIGELSSMYKDGEIVINPEYQRYYVSAPFPPSSPTKP